MFTPKPMKTTSLLLLAVSLLFLSWSHPAQADPLKPQIKEGDSVAALWSDGNYYVGTVTGITKGDRYRILFEDGDRKPVDASDVYLLRANREFAIGEHVLAAWKGARMYPGVVTAIFPNSCRIKWDDGDKPLEVKRDRIIFKGRK